MTLNEAIKAYLSSYSGLTSLVGKRVYPDTIRQDPKYPAIEYSRISTDRVHAFCKDTGLTAAVFQFTITAQKRSDCEAVANQLRYALQDYSGVMGGVGGVTINAVLIVSEMDDLENGPDGTVLHYITYQDFEIWHQEV